MANPNLPLGGGNQGGHGSYPGYFGFRELGYGRGVLRQSPWFSALELLYPPYGALGKRLADLTRRFLL